MLLAIILALKLLLLLLLLLLLGRAVVIAGLPIRLSSPAPSSIMPIIPIVTPRIIMGEILMLMRLLLVLRLLVIHSRAPDGIRIFIRLLGILLV